MRQYSSRSTADHGKSNLNLYSVIWKCKASRKQTTHTTPPWLEQEQAMED